MARPVDEKTFDQAVQLATTFVANGDIRLCGNTNENATALIVIRDLIPALYNKLEEAKELLRVAPRDGIK